MTQRRVALHYGVDRHVIALAIGHSRASTTELYQHVNDALQHEGFAHLAAVAPKHEPEPDGDSLLAEVVDLRARRRRA